MENLILVFTVLILAQFIWFKLKGLFQRKPPKNSPKEKTKPNAKSEREVAISHLMANLQKAKTNRPEIIEENPELAAKVLKLWANKK
jgi:flagellar biosynthesis/type III secretory pathway M-ring protein FliF/YscJ